MTRDLSKLLRPKSIAVIGGGAWCRNVIAQCQKMNFAGPIWPVHPSAPDIGGLRCVTSVADLPEPPDASFIGVNRDTTLKIVSELETVGAGGAVCFASGFLEAEMEDATSADRQIQLLAAAANMPILGPNCYGFINYLDGALLWPDQHGGKRVKTGVAIITQSSNIAINLTMQRRNLPLAYIVTAGNQAQTGIAGLGMALLADTRVTALGLHIEGFGDLRTFEALAKQAAALNKPIVVLKAGKSQQAQAAALSHTASLAGQDAGAQALLDRLGIARVASLPSFLETLKLLHVLGPLPGNTVASISCSGGEASLAADTALGINIAFPPLNKRQKTDLRAALGPKVALANPLDYHTYIWTDTPAMTQAFSAMCDPGIALTMLIVDFPRDDRCDAAVWQCAIDAALATKAQTGANIAMVATLPELMPENVAATLMAGGVVPIGGLDEALLAFEAAVTCHPSADTPADLPPVLLPVEIKHKRTLSEAGAKADLAVYGVCVPASVRATSPEEAAMKAAKMAFPLVLKGEGAAHKTESGLVRLNLNSANEIGQAAHAMASPPFLIEEMITDVVAELLIGVIRDPAHGYVLTIAAGGILSEILTDRQSLLIPASVPMVRRALTNLKIHTVLTGYRGRPGANMGAIVDTVMAVQEYVIASGGNIDELEINPLLCGTKRAVAADALIIAKENP